MGRKDCILRVTAFYIPYAGQNTGLQKFWQHTNTITRNRLPRIIRKLQTNRQKNQWRPLNDFWVCVTGMGQQMAQLYVSYIMMMK